MADGGFIKLYRSMLKWEWYSDVNTKSVFLHMLLTAQHEDIEWRGIEIKRGQVVIGRKKLAKDLGLSEQQIRTSIKRLKSTTEITTIPTNKYTLVTITKYEDYQNKDAQPTNKATNKRPTNNQQSTTNKNVKNDKNIINKNIYGEFGNVKLTDSELEKLKNEYPDYKERIERLSAYIASKNKRYSSHYATILNWARKDTKEVKPVGHKKLSGINYL